jgi:hypothetical protein
MVLRTIDSKNIAKRYVIIVIRIVSRNNFYVIGMMVFGPVTGVGMALLMTSPIFYSFSTIKVGSI